MTTKSHSYAEKIVPEHPTAVYIFDDELLNSTQVPLGNFDSTLSSTNGKVLRSVTTASNVGFITSSVTLAKVSPIVHGSDYSVYASGSNKTINIPAQGILNYNGRYNNNTLEFWTKIDKPYLGKRKIVGPFTPTDDGNGLYVNQSSFILQIGTQKETAYIKDFNRPLLIQITNSANSTSLIVNGELLISLSLLDSDLSLLPDTKYLSFGPGTYDCISTYAYKVDATQAMRRFGFGQGVGFQENVVRAFNGKSVIVDYSKSKYATNYNYTTNASWKQSKTDNLLVESYALSNFQYEKPILNSDSKTIDDLESTISGTTFSLKAGTMSTAISNLQIDSLNMMNQPTKAFYIHGYYTQAQGRPTSEEILFKIVNKKTKDYFTITVNGYNIYYKLKYQTGTEYTVISFSSPASNLVLYGTQYNFIIGIDIEKFATYCINNNQQSKGTDIRNFFANQEDLIVYIGGDDDLTVSKTLTASIYSVKFLTQENLDQRPSLVFSSGIFQYPSAINTNPSGTEATQNNIIGSYDIRPYKDTLEYVDTGYRLSVATNGYWKNDVPLSQFCKTVKDSSNNDVFTFDFVQFNIDYESSLLSQTISSKKYFDTTNYESYVKTYVTFEPLGNTYQTDATFTTTVGASSDRTLIPGSGWETKKYEVVDGFIIYPPTGIDLTEYTMVIHIDFNVLDTENNFVNLQQMQLASQAYNANSSNPLGTKFGTEIIPYTYTLNGATRIYDYKAYNPFLINKKENPYIYMARDSGIRLVGFDTTTAGVYRGIRLPINPGGTETSLNISVMQLSIFYNSERDTSSAPFYAKFPYSSEQIFEIKTNTRTIQFFLTRTGSGNTATISALSNGITNENISYYLNGKYESSPSISTNEWYNLGIAFVDPLIFDATEGEFALVGGISIDNLSYYQFTSEQISQLTTPLNWSTYLPYDWSYLSNNYLWGELSVVTAISSKDMYSMFTGTNRITGISNNSMNFGLVGNGYDLYSDISSEIKSYYAT